MNSKGITVLDGEICMICQKENATHTYGFSHRGYGSDFDGENIEFKCCDRCNRKEFPVWFNEESHSVFPEEYKYEDELYKFLNSLPVNSKEKIFNDWMDSQDWIDWQLDELSDDKRHKYGLFTKEEKLETLKNDLIKEYQTVADKLNELGIDLRTLNETHV